MAEIKEKAKPFFYASNPGSDSLAILIHGFTGSLYDLREIGQHLANQGIDAKGVRLAGHGSCPEDLVQTCAGDWWQSVNQEIQNFKDKYQKIFLVGYSFGANLAIDFAVRYPETIKSIILLGPSVFIRKDKLARFLLPFKRIYKKYYKKKFSSPDDLLEYEEQGGYSKIPLKSIQDFFSFIDNYTKKEVPFLKIPTLIVQSRNDKVVHPKSAYYIYNKINNPQKELLLLDNHEHNPFFSDTKKEIFEKVSNFLKNNC